METVLNQREIASIKASELPGEQYSNEDVLPQEGDRRVRRVNLDKAVTLGKSAKLKTDLVIQTIAGYRHLRAQVIALNDKGITIAEGYFIPMHVVYSVDVSPQGYTS